MGIVKEILDGVGTISKDWEKGKFKKIGNYTLNTPNFIEIANNAML